MWNSKNIKYLKYKFEWLGLEIQAEYINHVINSFDQLQILTKKGEHEVDQTHEILRIALDLVISMDKNLWDNNLVAYLSCMTVAREYILKFSLLISNYCEGSNQDLEEQFYSGQEIKVFKLWSKVLKKIPNKLLKDLQIFPDDELLNDSKHLNRLSIIHFHNGLAQEDGENVDGKGTWVDEMSYQFAVMDNLSDAVRLMMLIIYRFKVEQLILPNTLYENLPLKNSNYSPHPWFVKYIKREIPSLIKILFDKNKMLKVTNKK